MPKMKVIKKILIIFISILTIYIMNIETFASSNINKDVGKYEIMKSEENEFLEYINGMANDNLKIVKIDKKISEKNYELKEYKEEKLLEDNTVESIKQSFEETREYKDNNFEGILTIYNIDIETINNGYYEKINEKRIPFTNYLENDLNNIDKKIKINNKIYYLINVIWEYEDTKQVDLEPIPVSYKGTKIYQTIEKFNNPNTYKATVLYRGRVERIDTLYEYEVSFESIEKDKSVIPIISGLGITLMIVLLILKKNIYVYSKTQKGYKLIKRTNINNNKLSVDITKCKRKSYEDIYAIKIKKGTLKKLKGRTISLVLGKKKKDIALWNNYYEIKL
ncbi:MAG: hypothetical protein Q4G09_07045 [Clostridia bacterium]|nr:hypothetical protein [Clostridia bacterium]